MATAQARGAQGRAGCSRGPTVSAAALGEPLGPACLPNRGGDAGGGRSQSSQPLKRDAPGKDAPGWSAPDRDLPGGAPCPAQENPEVCGTWETTEPAGTPTPTYPGVINLVRSFNLNVQGGPHLEYSVSGTTSCRA